MGSPKTVCGARVLERTVVGFEDPHRVKMALRRRSLLFAARVPSPVMWTCLFMRMRLTFAARNLESDEAFFCWAIFRCSCGLDASVPDFETILTRDLPYSRCFVAE